MEPTAGSCAALTFTKPGSTMVLSGEKAGQNTTVDFANSSAAAAMMPEVQGEAHPASQECGQLSIGSLQVYDLPPAFGIMAASSPERRLPGAGIRHQARGEHPIRKAKPGQHAYVHDEAATADHGADHPHHGIEQGEAMVDIGLDGR